MKITTEAVTKLIITDVKNLDPVAVYLEDQGPECGKVTITCFNDCWSYFWGSMGKDNTIRSFLLQCDEHYLAGKFAPHLASSVDYPEKLVELAKKEIARDRLNGRHTKEKARIMYNDADDLLDLWHEFNGQGGETYRNRMHEIFGDEFWYSIPQQPNPKYEYLCRIINVVQEALRRIP